MQGCHQSGQETRTTRIHSSFFGWVLVSQATATLCIRPFASSLFCEFPCLDIAFASNQIASMLCIPERASSAMASKHIRSVEAIALLTMLSLPRFLASAYAAACTGWSGWTNGGSWCSSGGRLHKGAWNLRHFTPCCQKLDIHVGHLPSSVKLSGCIGTFTAVEINLINLHEGCEGIRAVIACLSHICVRYILSAD